MDQLRNIPDRVESDNEIMRNDMDKGPRESYVDQAYKEQDKSQMSSIHASHAVYPNNSKDISGGSLFNEQYNPQEM